jgi:hypothetical protein
MGHGVDNGAGREPVWKRQIGAHDYGVKGEFWADWASNYFEDPGVVYPNNMNSKPAPSFCIDARFLGLLWCDCSHEIPEVGRPEPNPEPRAEDAGLDTAMNRRECGVRRRKLLLNHTITEYFPLRYKKVS